MRICHATNSLTRTGGGTANVVWGLACAQRRLGNRISLLGLSDPYDRFNYPDRYGSTIQVHTFKRSGPYGFGWSSTLHAFLNRDGFASDIDLLHQHGIWSLLSHSISSLRRTHRLPTIIATHGMLSATALQQGRWKKKLFGAVIERGNLSRAFCLHALCAREAESMREYGLTNPIAVIPNGIDISRYADLPDAGAFADRFAIAKGRPIVLFMSRLDTLKGPTILIEAWKNLDKARRAGWLLVIAGQGKPRFKRKLREAVISSGLGNDILFTGQLYGDHKSEALSASDAFVLPSLSEGFPIAVLEAMACRLPVIITDRCNIDDVEKYRAGWIGEPTVASIAEMLGHCIALSATQRKAIGENGFDLVSRKYTLDSAAAQSCDVYNWVLGNRDRPANVLMD